MQFYIFCALSKTFLHTERYTCTLLQNQIIKIKSVNTEIGKMQSWIYKVVNAVHISKQSSNQDFLWWNVCSNVERYISSSDFCNNRMEFLVTNFIIYWFVCFLKSSTPTVFISYYLLNHWNIIHNYDTKLHNINQLCILRTTSPTISSENMHWCLTDMCFIELTIILNLWNCYKDVPKWFSIDIHVLDAQVHNSVP